MEAAFPSWDKMYPKFNRGSNRCETFKTIFGITYEQMQEKNITSFYESLSIDLITKNGNIKYNMTASNHLTKLLANANEIMVLIHGFLESSEGVMVQGIAPELLKKTGYTILALDGRKVINLEYFRSSTYARFMGEKLGNFLGDIIKGGQDPSKITLIGHSLGAHIAGIAGQKVQEVTKKSIARIVALDPAGPCFGNVSATNRLDKSDAEYVDVLHTNAGILGLLEPVGHKDFYANGGRSQPGCLLSTCDHTRAWQLFAESLTMPDNFPARKCENWTKFKDGLCAKNEVAFTGINSKPGKPGLYFFNTKSSSPYGLGSAGSG
ncbi:phospholipase A1 VesT1.02-like [Achroia grisella]|uniref:phospholipase A1 VesT1.02-like n=1 Tax=Achroia grisella TaxID=688607 RepID=UPI0027D2D736|nr:phospholipase A1 VesT1.02-like [Achroia grisella]